VLQANGNGNHHLVGLNSDGCNPRHGTNMSIVLSLAVGANAYK